MINNQVWSYSVRFTDTWQRQHTTHEQISYSAIRWEILLDLWRSNTSSYMADDEEAMGIVCGLVLTEKKQNKRSLLHPPDILVFHVSCSVFSILNYPPCFRHLTLILATRHIQQDACMFVLGKNHTHWDISGQDNPSYPWLSWLSWLTIGTVSMSFQAD